MTEDEAYKVHIQYTFNAFCKIVIRHAAIDKILKLRRRWEREVSLDYLMNEKFVQFAEPEQFEEYLFTACGQTAALYHAETGNLPSSRFWRKKGWRALCAERPFRCPSAKEKRKVPAHKAGAFAKRFCPLAKAPAFCCLFPRALRCQRAQLAVHGRGRGQHVCVRQRPQRAAVPAGHKRARLGCQQHTGSKCSCTVKKQATENKR